MEWTGEDEPSPVEDLQQIVDEAARELGCPVAMEDRALRLLAFSAHEERDVDPVRAASILRRVNANADAVAWFGDHGAFDAERAVRIPGNPALSLRPRVCAPVRCQGTLLGYLWLIDDGGTASDADLARMEQIAAAAGVVVYRERLLRHLDRSRERELVRDILSDDERVRRDAAAQLVELGIVAADGPLAAIVLRLPPLRDGGTPDDGRVAVDAALGRLRRRLLPKHALHLVRPDHAVLLVSRGEPSVRKHGPAALAAQAREEVAAALGEGPAPRRAAVGGRAAELAAARAAYDQALRALHVAEAVGGRFGEVVGWEELGVYRLLVELPLDRIGPEAIHPGVRTLLELPAAHDLLHTLETYLDLAGDAQATAAALHVHRTTLHHRLRRAQQMAGIDLRSGDERLALHLGLKLAHLQGWRWDGSSVDERTDADAQQLSSQAPRRSA